MPRQLLQQLRHDVRRRIFTFRALPLRLLQYSHEETACQVKDRALFRRPVVDVIERFWISL